MTTANTTGHQTIAVQVLCKDIREAVNVDVGASGAGDIYPGMIVRRVLNTNPTNDVFGFGKTTAAAQVGGGVLVAMEDKQENKDFETAYTGNSADTDFNSSATDKADIVKALPLNSGDKILAVLAAGEAAITEGDQLELDTAGTLKEVATANTNVFATALESVDNSAKTERAFILVEVK